MSKKATKMFAWPFDVDPLGGGDDGHCLERVGFEVSKTDHDYLMKRYAKRYEKEWGEPLDDDAKEDVGFFIVGPDTHKAANQIETGDWDSQDMRNIASRKKILKAGSIEIVKPAKKK